MIIRTFTCCDFTICLRAIFLQPAHQTTYLKCKYYTTIYCNLLQLFITWRNKNESDCIHKSFLYFPFLSYVYSQRTITSVLPHIFV